MNTLLTFALAAGTFYHAMLKSSIPARGAVLGHSPAQVTLVFTEDVNLAGSAVSILRSDSTEVAKLVLHAGAKADTVRGAVTSALPAGKYLVKWRAAAADDGHRTTGLIPFTVTGK